MTNQEKIDNAFLYSTLAEASYVVFEGINKGQTTFLSENLIDALGAYLGISGGFDRFHDYVVELNQSLGIPANLTELGATDPDLDWLVEQAMKDPSCGGNPIEMTDDYTRRLYEACF